MPVMLGSITASTAAAVTAASTALPPLCSTCRPAADASDCLVAIIPLRPTAGERVAAELDIEPGSPTLFVERLRVADGDPFLLEQAYLPAERFPGLLNANLECRNQPLMNLVACRQPFRRPAKQLARFGRFTQPRDRVNERWLGCDQ